MNHDMLLSRCRTELIGVSTNAIRQALFNVFQEFFDFTSAWKEQIPFTLTANQQIYTLTSGETPPGRILRLEGVWDVNRVQWAATAVDYNIVPSPTSTNQTPLPATGNAPALGTLDLYEVPSATQQAYASVIKTVRLPDEDSSFPDVPAWVYQRYNRALEEGVLSTLFNQPDKPYSNRERGKYHRQMFNMNMVNARVTAARGNTHGRQAWAFPQSFRTRSQRGGVSTGSVYTW